MSETTARVLLAAALVSVLAISAAFRRRAAAGAPARAGEPLALRAARVVAGGALLVAVLAYLAEPRWMAWARVELPAWARWLGAVLALAAGPLVAWTLASLGPNVTATVFTRDDHQLVTRGPYRRVRHPLYVVGFLFQAGAALVAASAAIAALAVATVAFLRFAVVPREEAELEARFGERYRAWRCTTGAFVPRWRR